MTALGLPSVSPPLIIPYIFPLLPALPDSASHCLVSESVTFHTALQDMHALTLISLGKEWSEMLWVSLTSIFIFTLLIKEVASERLILHQLAIT